MQDVKALIDGDILVYRVGFSIDDPEEEKFAISRMGHFIDNLLSIEGVESYSGFITGKKNYRQEIATEAPYKGNRAKARRPVHYDTLREYLTGKWGFELVEGQEADDAIGIGQIFDHCRLRRTQDLPFIIHCGIVYFTFTRVHSSDTHGIIFSSFINHRLSHRTK